MKNNSTKFLAFNKNDETRFQAGYAELSIRARKALASSEIYTWSGLYYHFLIIHDIGEFDKLRFSGVLTQKELLTFARTILNPNGLFSAEMHEFDSRKSNLRPNAKATLLKIGISLFETFYYRLVIQREIIDIKSEYRCSGIIGTEVEEFVESFCLFLGIKRPRKEDVVYFNPKNPRIPFNTDRKLKNSFQTEFINLSRTTRANLSRIGADDMEGFYIAFMHPKSPFNLIFKEFEESTLLELLRFRSVLKDHIRTQKFLARSF